MKILIVDDEISTRKNIIHLFNHYCNDPYEIIEAGNIQKGIDAIEKQHPDIVLLDINLPDGSGFDLLKRLQSFNFKLIFITAHEEFALKAYEFSAIGFVLKPIIPKKLFKAIEKARYLLEKENVNFKLNALFAKLDNPVSGNNKLELITDENTYIINMNDIIRCESYVDSTQFHLLDGRKIMTSLALQEYENILDGNGFFCVHASHIINLKYIDHYSNNNGGAVIMKDKSTLPVAGRKKESFLKLLDVI